MTVFSAELPAKTANTTNSTFLAFDLGGTALKVGIVTIDINGESSLTEIYNEEHHLFADGPAADEKLQELLTQHYHKLIDDGYSFDGIGVATFGSVNPDTKRIQHFMDGTPGYENWSWTEVFEDAGFNGPVDVLNDGQAGALGICASGGIQGTNVALIIGTGLAAGAANIDQDGNATLTRGGTGNGGLFGNTLVSSAFENNSELFNRRAGELIATGGISKFYKNGELEPADALRKLVVDLANDEDRAKNFYDQVLVEGLAALITNIHWTYDPQRVAISGGVIKALPDLVQDAMKVAIVRIQDNAELQSDGMSYSTCLNQDVVVQMIDEQNPNLTGIAVAAKTLGSTREFNAEPSKSEPPLARQPMIIK